MVPENYVSQSPDRWRCVRDQRTGQLQNNFQTTRLWLLFVGIGVKKIHKLQTKVQIHPMALVDPGAELGSGVTIGAFSVIGAGVVIGDGTEIMNHVTIEGPTRIGKGNRFFPYVSIGMEPQDKKFEGEACSTLTIGDGNTFREFVTIHRGTRQDKGCTSIGDDNWVMAYCHIAHDCTVGNKTIFANGATLGGHVVVEDMALLGGFTAVHQHCTIGAVSMTGGHTMVAQDIAPFTKAVGNRVKLFGINRIGLDRNGYSPEEINNILRAYRIFFRSKLSASEGLLKLEQELGHSPAVRHLIGFIKNSKRGLCR